MKALEITDLRVAYFQRGVPKMAVDGVSLHIEQGETLALVGESGSGKSTVALSAMRLVRPPIGEIRGGSIRINGTDVIRQPARRLRALLRRDVGYVPQDPTAALDPLCRVGRHITETLDAPRGEARKIAIEMLDELGVADAGQRIRSYPHQFSGGMRQRVAIATALAKRPALVIADEPTTALDVTTQLGILRLLARERHERHLAMLFVTHDLSVASALCDRIAVMYAGRLVEEGATQQIMQAPQHPYTRALIACVPAVGDTATRLPTIAGTPPALGDRPAGCAFATRCPLADDRCREHSPPIEESRSSKVACWKAGVPV